MRTIPQRGIGSARRGNQVSEPEGRRVGGERAVGFKDFNAGREAAAAGFASIYDCQRDAVLECSKRQKRQREGSSSTPASTSRRIPCAPPNRKEMPRSGSASPMPRALMYASLRVHSDSARWGEARWRARRGVALVRRGKNFGRERDDLLCALRASTSTPTSGPGATRQTASSRCSTD